MNCLARQRYSQREEKNLVPTPRDSDLGVLARKMCLRNKPVHHARPVSGCQQDLQAPGRDVLRHRWIGDRRARARRPAAARPSARYAAACWARPDPSATSRPSPCRRPVTGEGRAGVFRAAAAPPNPAPDAPTGHAPIPISQRRTESPPPAHSAGGHNPPLGTSFLVVRVGFRGDRGWRTSVIGKKCAYLLDSVHCRAARSSGPAASEGK